MVPHSGDPGAATHIFAPPVRDAAHEHRRLIASLAYRARAMGSRDPESAAQEALKRSIENPRSQGAIEYYFGGDDALPPEWSLDQLLAWLHAVLRHVVLEEQNRASYRREVPMTSNDPENGGLDPAHPAPLQLDLLIQQELESIVADCLPKLDREYRTVLRMRANGLKYGEIASRLGVNENTVATWVSRGIRTLAQSVRSMTRRSGRRS